MTQGICSSTPYSSKGADVKEPACTTVAKVKEASHRYFIEAEDYNRLQWQASFLRTSGGLHFVGVFYGALYLVTSEKLDVITAICVMTILCNGIFFMALGSGQSISLSHAKRST